MKAETRIRELEDALLIKIAECGKLEAMIKFSKLQGLKCASCKNDYLDRVNRNNCVNCLSKGRSISKEDQRRVSRQYGRMG